jgi:hypothetical protein
VNPEPVTVTLEPTDPEVGLKLEIVGAGGGVPVTENELELVPVPPGPVTVIGPDCAPPGTVVVILVSLETVNVAAVPPNVTAVAPVNPEPVTVTLAPTCPLVGAKLETVGGGGPEGVHALVDAVMLDSRERPRRYRASTPSR